MRKQALHICCDLDGVITNFVDPSLAAHNRFDLIADKAFPHTYDYWHAMGLTKAEFWAPIEAAGSQWWASLPKLPWADGLIRLLREADPQWSIATKPVMGAGCQGKWEWCKRHLEDRRLHLTTDKCELASPDRLLIDDVEANVDMWQSLGGAAILCPATHNKLRHLCGRELEVIYSGLRVNGYDV